MEKQEIKDIRKNILNGKILKLDKEQLKELINKLNKVVDDDNFIKYNYLIKLEISTINNILKNK